MYHDHLERESKKQGREIKTLMAMQKFKKLTASAKHPAL